MEIWITLLVSFGLLVGSVLQGYFVAYPLLLAMAMVMAVLWRRGVSLRRLLHMAYSGSQQSFGVISVLLLIGVVIASWMAAGTVPALVYYGMQLIRPPVFIVAAFLLTSGVSLLMGTSFGAAGTIGVALMIMAKPSGVDPHMIAGAIIAGAYVGDRGSALSSSAALIATVTQTRLYTNIQQMWRTAVLPLGLSIAVYAVLSWLNPVTVIDQTLTAEISRSFAIHPVVLLPAIAVVGLSLMQVEVKRSMLVSVGLAGAIALGYQHLSLGQWLAAMVMGFRLEASHPLYAMFSGGGLVSMARVSLVVMLSTAFVGLFQETSILTPIEASLRSVSSRRGCFLSTGLVGLGSAAFGCTQTIAILLTHQLVKQRYHDTAHSPHQLALDLENTVVVLAPLIPWNIAGLVPATVLQTDVGFIPFAVYLYLVPLLNLLHLRLSPPSKLRLCN